MKILISCIIHLLLLIVLTTVFNNNRIDDVKDEETIDISVYEPEEETIKEEIKEIEYSSNSTVSSSNTNSIIHNTVDSSNNTIIHNTVDSNSNSTAISEDGITYSSSNGSIDIIEGVGNSIGNDSSIVSTSSNEEEYITTEVVEEYESSYDVAYRFANAVSNNIIYPDVAKRRNQSGTVYINLTLSRDGNIIDYYISSSSGVSSLDKEAVEAIFRVVPFPVNINSDINITIPIVFEIL